MIVGHEFRPVKPTVHILDRKPGFIGEPVTYLSYHTFDLRFDLLVFWYLVANRDDNLGHTHSPVKVLEAL